MANFFVVAVAQTLIVYPIRLAFSLGDASNFAHLRKSYHKYVGVRGKRTRRAFIRTPSFALHGKTVHTSGAGQNLVCGFTLIEMIVVIAMMTLLAAVVLSQGLSSRGQFELLNAAHNLSLVLREAQTYGASTRETSAGSGVFDKAYGVAFSSSNLSGATLFQDSDDDEEYGGGGEFLSSFTLPGRVSISRFCGIRPNGSEDCSGSGSLTALAVLFKRPRTDAIVQGLPRNNTHTGARIYLTSSNGGTRTVTVYTTGQIAVQ